jgi:hypothetical protein
MYFQPLQDKQFLLKTRQPHRHQQGHFHRHLRQQQLNNLR